jgi:hypothetical protein
MDKYRTTIIVCAFCAALPAAAEVTRLPFFVPAPVFTELPETFPAFRSWISLDHALNQREAPDTAHCFDTGMVLTFWSGDLVSVSGLARELFQFQAHPEGEWMFWSRALVTDLRLEAAVNLEPVTVSAGYWHDCKHDINEMRREMIHDALFARATMAVTTGANVAFEAEANLPTVFQTGPAECDRARLTAETELVPFAIVNGRGRFFIDGRVSLVRREANERIAADQEWNADWLVRTGIWFRAGLGNARLSFDIERISDDWVSVRPEAQMIEGISLLILFESRRPTRASIKTLP